MKFFKVIILSVALTVVWSSSDNLEDYDQDSQDSQDDHDQDQDQDQDHPMLSPHEFIVKKTQWKTGKKKGEEKFSVTLEVAPYIFRNQYNFVHNLHRREPV
jgi:hypothetical protein